MSAVPDPVELLRDLLRFDTTNPPGRERGASITLRGLLSAAGVESELYSRDPERTNLVARLPGSGHGSPLLLYGHVDVVPTAGPAVDASALRRGGRRRHGLGSRRNRHEGRRGDDGHGLPAGEGRGPLAAGRARPRRGLDEEAGGDFGAKFLAQEHPDALAGVRHALGEVGGVAVYMGGRRFYPIQVAEKQLCHIKATVRGPGGHAGTADARWRDGAARNDAAGARPQAHACRM